jgi:hypothetical protein
MRLLWAASSFLIVVSNSLSAADLFSVQAQSTDLFPRLVRDDGSSDLLNLLQSTIKAQGDFAKFQNRDYNAAFKYLNVTRAIMFDVSSDGTTAFLRIPITGLRKEFQASSRNDLYNLIKNYLKRDGANEWAKFLEAINQRSALALSDGNPNSTTALLASTMFNSFGSQIGSSPGDSGGKGSTVSITFDAGQFDANGYKGQAYTLPIAGKIKISNRVSIDYQVPLQYITLHGALIYQAGITLNVPTKVILPSEDQPWSWDVTPTVAFAVSGSKEMLAGGGLFAGALTNVVSYRWHDIAFTYGNYFSFFQGVTLSYSDYEFASKVSQEIMKNGLRMSVPFEKRWLFEVYGIHTKFFESAAVDSYFATTVSPQSWVVTR